MLAAYYPAHGWDPATGRPTREKLKELEPGFCDSRALLMALVQGIS